MEEVLQFIRENGPENITIVCSVKHYKEVKQYFGELFEIACVSNLPDEDALDFILTSELEKYVSNGDPNSKIFPNKIFMKDIDDVYEAIPFVPGDEVKLKDKYILDSTTPTRFIVTAVEEDLERCSGVVNYWVDCITETGRTWSTYMDSFERTGRHFDVINVALKNLKEAMNNE